MDVRLSHTTDDFQILLPTSMTGDAFLHRQDSTRSIPEEGRDSKPLYVINK